MASKEAGGTDEARVGARARAPRTLVPERMLVNIPRTLRGPGNSFLKELCKESSIYLVDNHFCLHSPFKESFQIFIKILCAFLN